MKFALSTVLSSVLFQGALSSNHRAEARLPEKDVRLDLDSLRAHAKKHLEIPLKFESPTNEDNRILASTCPSFLKVAKKIKTSFLFCQVDSTMPIAPMNCVLYPCDGCNPAAIFAGTLTSTTDATVVYGKVIYLPDSAPVSGQVYIISDVSGVIAGTSADFPITFTSTVPYGNNACGANAFKYLHLDITVSDTAAFAGYVTFN